MKTVRDLLKDADPLRNEPHRLDGARDRLRQSIVSAASDDVTPRSRWFRAPVAVLAVAALIVLAVLAVGSQIWSPGATLQAAVRFEVRLAEDRPSPGLREARVAGSERVIYLHQEIVVTNSDVERSAVVDGSGPSRFGVGVEFNEPGAERMRQATADHVGRPVAILIDGDVVTAPVLRSPISASAVISGDYTRAEAQRIVDGISIR